MNVLHLKAGVTLDPIAPAGGAIIAALGMAADRLQRDLTITCGSDSHPPTDPHTRGLAYDVRVSDLSEAQILSLVTGLQRDLGPLFTVLYEVPAMPSGVLASLAYVNPSASAPHLHIQRRKSA